MIIDSLVRAAIGAPAAAAEPPRYHLVEVNQDGSDGKIIGFAFTDDPSSLDARTAGCVASYASSVVDVATGEIDRVGALCHARDQQVIAKRQAANAAAFERAVARGRAIEAAGKPEAEVCAEHDALDEAAGAAHTAEVEAICDACERAITAERAKSAGIRAAALAEARKAAVRWVRA